VERAAAAESEEDGQFLATWDDRLNSAVFFMARLDCEEDLERVFDVLKATP